MELLTIIKKHLSGFQTAEQMKPKVMKNALKKVACGATREDVIGMYDTTVFSSGKSGFVFTNSGIYSNEFASLNKSADRYLPFEGLREVSFPGKDVLFLTYEKGETKKYYFCVWAKEFLPLLKELTEAYAQEEKKKAEEPLAETFAREFLSEDFAQKFLEETSAHEAEAPAHEPEEETSACEITGETPAREAETSVCEPATEAPTAPKPAEKAAPQAPASAQTLDFDEDFLMHWDDDDEEEPAAKEEPAPTPSAPFEDAWTLDQPDGYAEYCQAGEYYEKGDLKKAFELMSAAADKGYAQAQLDVGTMYANGMGTERKNGLALFYTMLAAENGSEEAQEMLRSADPEGIRWVKKNESNIYMEIALKYLAGHSKEDRAMALKFVETAATRGSNPKVMYLCAEMYLGGDGVEPDLNKVVEYYRKAAAHGDLLSSRLAAAIEKDGKNAQLSEIRELYKLEEKAKAGDTDAAFDCANRYALGLGTTPDHKKAFGYYQIAANDAGNFLALSACGDCYYDGDGTTRNYRMALSYYERAAEAGSPQAASQCSYMYSEGIGTTADPKKAAYYSAKAKK